MARLTGVSLVGIVGPSESGKRAGRTSLVGVMLVPGTALLSDNTEQRSSRGDLTQRHCCFEERASRSRGDARPPWTNSERVGRASGSRSLRPGETTVRHLAHETLGRRPERARRGPRLRRSHIATGRRVDRLGARPCRHSVAGGTRLLRRGLTGAPGQRSRFAATVRAARRPSRSSFGEGAPRC